MPTRKVPASPKKKKPQRTAKRPTRTQSKESKLKQELDSAKKYQQQLIEEYEAAQEELKLTNEKLHKKNRELEQSERRFRLMITNVKDYAIFMLDAKGRVATWNEGARRLKGYSASEIIGQHFSQFYTEDEKKWKPAMEVEGVTREGRWEDEGWRVRKDGSRFWANVVITEIRDAENRLLGFVKITRDLTDRKNLEQTRFEKQRQEFALKQLQESEEQFRMLANSLPQLAWTADSEGNINWYNKRWYEFTGTYPDSMRGWGWQSVHDPEMLPIVLEKWRHSVATGEPFEMEFPIRRADGTYHWFLTQAQPVRDAQGDVRRWFGTNTDIDEKKRSALANEVLASASLVFSESLDFDKTLQRLTDLITNKFADWCSVTLVDPAGLPQVVAVSHPDPKTLQEIKELFASYPLDWDNSHGAVRVIRTGESEIFPEFSEEVLREFAQDDHHLQLLRNLKIKSAMAVPLRARGKVLGAITFVSNSHYIYSDEDLELAEQLGHRAAIAVDNAILFRRSQEAVEIRDEFLSIASHELKTPLTSLQIQAQLRERSAEKQGFASLPPERLKKMFELDKRQLQRLARLIDDMLDVTRISGKKLLLAPEPTDLDVLIAEILERMAGQFSAAGSELDFKISKKLHGDFDRYRLEQAIVNLLTNALKYGQGKPVRISLEKQGEKALIKVRDEGVGIAESDQERIFHQFERAKNSAAATGLGLGLYIAKQIVEGHGGCIRVESKHGCGSTFIVELPLKK